MAAKRLYERLFGLKNLPSELGDDAERQMLTDYLDSIIKYSFHARNQLLLSEGQEAGYIYFLVKGIARGYYNDPSDGQERTVIIWDELSIFTDPSGFFENSPSGLNVEVMAGSQLLFISRPQLEELYRLFPYAEVFTIRMTSHYSAYFAKRSHDLVSLSAWERYQQLLKNYPQIELKITKKIIASYIDIAPQSLSRLIKENGHP
ncbi:cAMP-binding domain of CRP or a regulatory subunit of cAMP-dependent protein kinases [Mucilaginibacter pineti]|uniref:cAMP-binding domain of CRP or a regulatory subunit of cAMP-dependent protein kinases n=1 Tax=Mucilaginibacter pineti TaxID=1391627 RepID=A0A1G7LA39_9SPHI|nr:Crp/Fnr family transcriptional regulator [Mucilaginibacter pineti]SDF45869.1 cAMP-binding domain of CRP or a regulatory subunit of cAMP-dependent protein kinases [Mucilaginibacter pineti]